MIFCKYAIAARHTNPRENGKRYRRKATYTRQPRKKGGWPRSAIHTSAHRKRRSRSPTPACDLTGLSLSLMDCLRCSLLLRVGIPALLILNVPHFLHPAQPTHSPLRGVLSGRPDELTRGRVERDLLNEHPIVSLALPPLALRCPIQIEDLVRLAPPARAVNVRAGLVSLPLRLAPLPLLRITPPQCGSL